MWKDHGVADMSEAPPSTTSEGAFSTHQGMRRPRRVQGDLLMQKPTRGSVMASQARPTNRMMEAEKGSTWDGEQAKDDSLILQLMGNIHPH